MPTPDDSGGSDRPIRPIRPIRPVDQPALTVSELVGKLKSAVEGSLHHVWIRGEVSSFKVHGSGDWFFTLRDEQSCISCVMWKKNTRRGGEPDVGKEVFVLGSPRLWPKRGQLNFEAAVLLSSANIGLQQLERERVRLALEKDGLLDPARKRPLPELPRNLAVVTSEDGAALRDIITIARKRWPQVRLYLVPARVQGMEAPAALVRAFRIVNRLTKVDVCVFGRGGGSKEDLLAFDDERVCRSIAGLPMPSISAVGHETDLCLADLVADLRAATPSAAIERALPDRHAWLRHVASLGTRLGRGLRARTGLLGARLARTGDRIQVVMESRIAEPRATLEQLAAELEALSPLAVLARGYSVARRSDGRVIRRRADLPPATPFTLRVSDGEVPARAE